jgi:hypothetical protein
MIDRLFGPWYMNVPSLETEPFPHVVLDDFFDASLATSLEAEFQSPGSNDQSQWMRYWNPIEKKYARTDFTGLPATQRAFEALQSDAFVDKVRRVTGIPDLFSDPHLHGAGLHYHPRGGKLDMHLDYSIHPISGKERRLNLIVYLNRTWEPEWNGSLELWDKDFTGCVRTIAPAWNRAVLFRTSDLSFHGLPSPIACPEGTGRKSLAIYYVSPPRPDVKHRAKAEFRPLPWQPVSDRLSALYDLRASRRLTDADLYAGWDSDPMGRGYWY